MSDWIHDYCMQKHGVENEFKEVWNAHLYKIGGKIFAMHGENKDCRPLLTIKLEPAFSELLRARFTGDIIPGYYTDKVHWSSLFLDSDVPEDVARAMLDNGHETALDALPKKVQALIAESSSADFRRDV